MGEGEKIDPQVDEEVIRKFGLHVTLQSQHVTHAKARTITAQLQHA
jgi:hypothetical protein